MGRITPSHVAGLDLIDKLFFNQILVLCIFQEELKWLNELDIDLKRELTKRGVEGVKMQIVRHSVLCLLESEISDSILQLNEAFPDQLPSLPDNITIHQYEQVQSHNLEYFQAMVLAIMSVFHQCEDQVVIEIKNALLGKYKRAPVTVRHRLVDRMFSYEFMNAPIDCFTWLAKMEVLESSKYPSSRLKAKYDHEFLERLVLLCEFDIQRAYIHRNKFNDFEGSLNVINSIKNLSKNARKSIASQVLKSIEIDILGENKNTFPGINLSELENPVSIQHFFINLNMYRISFRVFQGSLAGFIGMLCGGMVEVMIYSDQKKSIYSAERNEGSLTEYISNIMGNRGFRINARTIYERHRDFKDTILKIITAYYELMRFVNVSIPPWCDDFAYQGVILQASQIKPKPRRNTRPSNS